MDLVDLSWQYLQLYRIIGLALGCLSLDLSVQNRAEGTARFTEWCWVWPAVSKPGTGPIYESLGQMMSRVGHGPREQSLMKDES